MTDLEITKACAEAMGWRADWTRPDFDKVKAIPVEQFPGAIHYQYAPLHDDAQAMALVKKFKMQLVFGADMWQAWDHSTDIHAEHHNLNRAICECVTGIYKQVQEKR